MLQFLKQTKYPVLKPVHFPNHSQGSDVWLVSFPKSGNTWIRFIIANLISLSTSSKTKVSFDTLQKFVPDIYFDTDLSSIIKSSWPRIIKTHSLHNPKYPRSIYLIRDPRDTMVSYYHYLTDGRGLDYKSFSHFLKDSEHGLKGWCTHVSNWQAHSDLTISYEALQKNPYQEVKKIINLIKVKTSKKQIEQAINSSQFKKMKKLEENSPAWKKQQQLSNKFSFMRKGKTKQWSRYFTQQDLSALKSLVNQYQINEHLSSLGYTF